MYRKFVAAFVALMITVGAVFAEEIKATFVKYEDGKVTVKVDDKEKTYTVDKDAMLKVKQKEFPLTKFFESPKRKEGQEMTLIVEKDKVVGVKFMRPTK